MKDIPHPETKHCSQCGKAFTCTHNADCWCMEYTLSPENLDKIRKKFTDCLCPECLSQYAQDNKKSPY